jgi:hypothetical protein
MSHADKPAPVLWIAMILLGACMVGTLYTVGLSAVMGADELPSVYRSEGRAADLDLAALDASARRGLGAQLLIDDQSVAVLLRDRSGATSARDAELRLSHATRTDIDQTLRLTNQDGRLMALLVTPLAAGDWLVEVRPPDGDWLLRGRVNRRGGHIGATPP